MHLTSKALLVIVLVLGVLALGIFIASRSSSPSSSSEETTWSPAATKAQEALAEELGVSKDQVEVIKEEAKEWSDSCLGLGSAVEICAQVITPGYEVTLKANDEEYLYHTNADGTVVRAATTQ